MKHLHRNVVLTGIVAGALIAGPTRCSASVSP
jgi:hypothetical protein